MLHRSHSAILIFFSNVFPTDLLDILSNIVDEKDLSVKDGNGNNILHVLMKMEDSNNVYRCINLVLKRVAVDPKETNKDGLKPSQLSELVSDKRVTLLEEFERDGRSGKKNKKKKKKNNVESPVECTVASTSKCLVKCLHYHEIVNALVAIFS